MLHEEVHNRRWLGVGRSTLADSGAAAIEAVNEARTGPDPKLLIVFAAITHDTAAVLDGVAQAAPGVPVIGCTTHGEIGAGGPADGTVTVAALGGPGLEISTCAAEHVSGRQADAGYEVASCMRNVSQPHRVLMLLTNGLVRDQESIVRGCYRALGAGIPLFGGAAADGWRMSAAYLFKDGHVLTDAVIGAAIASEAPIAVGFGHGYRTIGQPMIVTRAADGRVLTLDDRPALDVYLERLNAPPEAYTDTSAFTAFVLPRPLGVQRRSGIEARNLSTEVDLEGRSIGGGGAIDPGGLTWVMTGDEESILDAVDTVCQDTLGRLGGNEPIGMLTFSCAALRAVLGDDGIRRESERLQRWAGTMPFAGFYTYGEIARNHGIDGFHNQTLAVLALS